PLVTVSTARGEHDATPLFAFPRHDNAGNDATPRRATRGRSNGYSLATLMEAREHASAKSFTRVEFLP
ncbi:MAG: hypothetical protein LBD64_05975, partial [Odoribacteraceae bacterium]|nr:hypothetical protein [Odoribacteraceae bacterium]